MKRHWKAAELLTAATGFSTRRFYATFAPPLTPRKRTRNRTKLIPVKCRGFFSRVRRAERDDPQPSWGYVPGELLAEWLRVSFAQPSVRRQLRP